MDTESDKAKILQDWGVVQECVREHYNVPRHVFIITKNKKGEYEAHCGMCGNRRFIFKEVTE